MCNSLALAREVTEAHVLQGGAGDAAMSAMDYVEFVGAFDADLCRVKGVVEDAMMVLVLFPIARRYSGHHR